MTRVLYGPSAPVRVGTDQAMCDTGEPQRAFWPLIIVHSRRMYPQSPPLARPLSQPIRLVDLSCLANTGIDRDQSMEATTMAARASAPTTDVPTVPITAEGITSAPRTTMSYFTTMALESTDFAIKLKPVTPSVFFAEHVDANGRLVLDLMVDLGYFTVTGIRVREWQGQIALADGSKITSFGVSFKGIPVTPQTGGRVSLNVHRNERVLANSDVIEAGDFTVGGLSVYEIASQVWLAYQSGRFAQIDHEKAGVRRLSTEELAAKIEAAMAAKAERTAKRAQSQQMAEMPSSNEQAVRVG